MRYPPNELYSNDQPICPYCRTEISIDDWNPRDGDEEKMECPSCEKKFMVETQGVVKHSTVGDCALNGEMPHELKKHWVETGPYTCRKCHGEVYDWELPGGLHPKLKEGEFIILPKGEHDDFLQKL